MDAMDSENLTLSSVEDENQVLPDYVCCVVTEGVWTWFGASLLIVVLFAAATLKYCKKSLSEQKYRDKGQSIHLKCVLADDKGAISAIRAEPIDLADFLQV